MPEYDKNCKHDVLVVVVNDETGETKQVSAVVDWPGTSMQLCRRCGVTGKNLGWKYKTAETLRILKGKVKK